MNTKATCGDGNADNCPGCWQCEDDTEQAFFACVWANFKADVRRILKRNGMTEYAAHAATSALVEDDCGDLTVRVCAERILQGAKK